MLYFKYILISLAATASARPADEPSSSIVASDFSFVNWVDSIAADPSTALSPEKAVEAFNSGIKKDNTKRQTLEQRQTFYSCQQLTAHPAKVNAAVACINELAARGHAGQSCNVNSPQKTQCERDGAHLVTVKSGDGPNSLNCNKIARAGGQIMDHCTRGDGTVSGVSMIDKIAVHINGPN